MQHSEIETEDRDPVEALAEDFVRRLRLGDSPQLEEYARRFPRHAEQIRSLFPLLEAMEQNAPGASIAPLDRTVLSESVPERIGEFRVLREIGRGGMGVVYEAEQPGLGRRVALKLLPASTADDPDFQRRLRDEARALAQLEHTHIVPVFEVGEHHGRPYFSMKLLGGESLADRLREGPLNAREAAEILLPVCRAMAEAHARGIVHRDLKPSNILWDNDFRPLVADFGLARSTDPTDATVTGAVVGTPRYMSPEQARGRSRVEATCDVFSLGAVLYEMLTGRPPFLGTTVVETLMLVVEEEPAAPRLLNAAVDRELEAIALKCLEKDPAARYPSAAELSADLHAYLSDEPVSARQFRLFDLAALSLRETRYGDVFDSWGRAMMFQGFYLLAVYGLTAALKWAGIENHWAYYGLWAASFPFWYVGFNWLRRWRSNVTLIERQVSHLWTAGAFACVAVLVLEGVLRRPALELSPLFAIIQFGQFYTKANLISRMFYWPALAYLVCTIAMIVLVRGGSYAPGVAALSVVHFGAFFVPGFIYWRRREKRP